MWFLISDRRRHFVSFQAIEYDGRFFVNPGSATGAWSGSFTQYVHMSFALGPCNSVFLHRDPIPSFALMDIQGPVVVTYVYQLIDSEVRVEKIEFRKDVEVHAPRERETNGPRAVTMPQNIPSGAGASQQSVW